MARLFPRTYSSPVSRLMDRDPPRVYPDEPATRVRSLFRKTGSRVVYVVDRDGRLLGWITRGEILAVTSSKSAATAKSIMADPPVVLEPGQQAGPAVSRMLSVDEWYAPVVEDGRLVGSLGLEHVIASVLDENPEALRSVEVERVMTREVVSASVDDFVASIWRLMREHRYSGLPVVDSKGRLVGIVTAYDLLAEGARPAFEASGGPSRGPRVREVMTSPPVYLYPWSTLEEAARIMVKKGYGRLPVVDSETRRRLAGILDREDVVRFALEG